MSKMSKYVNFYHGKSNFISDDFIFAKISQELLLAKINLSRSEVLI